MPPPAGGQASLSFPYQFTPIAWPRRSPCSGTLLPFPDLPCLLTPRCSAGCRLQQERISKAIFKWQQNKVLFGDASFLGNHVSCYSNTKGDLFAETSPNNATSPVGNRKTCSFEKKRNGIKTFPSLQPLQKQLRIWKQHIQEAQPEFKSITVFTGAGVLLWKHASSCNLWF